MALQIADDQRQSCAVRRNNTAGSLFAAHPLKRNFQRIRQIWHDVSWSPRSTHGRLATTIYPGTSLPVSLRTVCSATDSTMNPISLSTRRR
jgi:hypothetical protein